MSENTGIKSSQDGFDINAAEKNLGFISTKEHLMVRSKGLVTATSFTYAHGLGYPPAFDGYAKIGRKYFPNFMAPGGFYGFENTTVEGTLCVDEDNLYASAPSANSMAYICYLNPIQPAEGNVLESIDSVGIKFSADDQNVLDTTMPAGKTHLNTAYQAPMIVMSGTATVVVDAISATAGGADVEKTNYTDVAHGQPQARHIIVPDYFEKFGSLGMAAMGFYPAPIGISQPYVLEGYEVYIDDDKIRFRVSRTASPGMFDNASASAKTVDFRWHLTNIILPS